MAGGGGDMTMKARFRIRRGEQEVRAETLQEFVALVRSGDISRDDLLQDKLTGEWGPAWAHPVYQLAMDPLAAVPADDGPMGESDTSEGGAELEDGPEPDELDGVDEGEAGSSEDVKDMDFAMELVDEERPSPEEEAQAFIEAMERERLEDSDGPEEELFAGLEAVERPRARATAWADDLPETLAESVSSVSDPDPDDIPDGPVVSGGGRRRALGVLGVAFLALGVTAAVAHPAFRFEAPFKDHAPTREARNDVLRPRPAPTDADLRLEARTGFLRDVDALRQNFSLGRVPPRWLEGRYLADASDYPEVGRFWTNYLRYVERVYGMEDDLYREAYLSVLDREGMGGPLRSLRLAGAMDDFRARAADRQNGYAGVWELALAARSLHDLLLEVEDDVTWEPADSRQLSADPVTEAVAGTPEVQARLDAALDRVLTALYDVTGGGRDVSARPSDWLARALADGVPAGGDARQSVSLSAPGS
jgi:hypothetical protein